MRLERLETGGFGRLGDLRLDLAPGVTVLVGPNECGKSTVHRAVRAALYGLDAGGQGRAAARSEWARWRPWEGRAYGVALQYTLADGRRFRIARRLEDRIERVQVHELGGGDVTDQLRSGRLVVPGLHHLGIDEVVFCATACVGEDALDAAAPDAPWRQTAPIQAAVERLADAAGRATAGEALARLRAARDRVGTENRSRSPLGRACSRLREVEASLADVRARAASLAIEFVRLQELEDAAAGAVAAETARRRDWLEARLTALVAHREERASARAEADRLEASTAGWAAWRSFPVDREERVVATGAELRLARETEVQARQRWDAAREEVRAAERRRAEIGTSIAALGGAPRVDGADRTALAALGTEVAGEASVERRVTAVAAAVARLDGLRREAAATGLGSIPRGRAHEVGDLLDVARERTGTRALLPLATAAAAIGLVGAAALFATHRPALAAGLLAVAVVMAIALAAMHRAAGGPGAGARRSLARLCPGMDTSPEGIERAITRLPRVAALHDDLARQEGIVEAGRAELDEASARLGELARRCLILAARIPVDVPEPVLPPAGAVALLARAHAALAAVEAAAAAGGRRVELEAEDRRLVERLAVLDEVRRDADRAAQGREELAAELARLCAIPGLEAHDDPALQVAAFRQAAATRRQLEAAALRLGEVRRRLQALGAADDGALAAEVDRLSTDLRAVGGDPDALATELPLEPGRLQALEVAAQRATQEAAQAATRAHGLRERLAGAQDGLPSIADLEDDRLACIAVRDRCRHQVAALDLAAERVEAAARRVHRDIAPRLSATLAAELAHVTDGRYAEVDIDAEHLTVTVRGPERLELVPVDLLSRGCRDQVALLLRVALAAVLGEGGERTPLLLDDPLQSSDPGRRAALVEALLRMSERTQVVLTTTDPAIGALVAAAGDGHAVLALGRAGYTRADMRAATASRTAVTTAP